MISRLSLPLNRRALLRGLVVLGIAVNLLLILGGVLLSGVGAGSRGDVPALSIAAQQRRLRTLEEALQKVGGVPEAEAETRAIALFSLAEEHRVQVWSLTNETRKDRFGAEEVQVFVTFLDLRGRRDDIVAFLAAVQETLQGNVVMSGVDARGTDEAWLIRLTVSQVIR